MEKLALIMTLADQLGVDLESNSVAIATSGSDAVARTSDGSIEARVSSSGGVIVHSPGSPAGIYIDLVDRSEGDYGIPDKAVYQIIAVYPPNHKYSETALEGDDEYWVFVGKDGIISPD